jgi:hypothetical protein
MSDLTATNAVANAWLVSNQKSRSPQSLAQYRAHFVAKWCEGRRTTSSFGHLSSADMCTIASTLRRKLYTESPLHMPIAPSSPLHPLTSKPGKKKLADARLLLLLSKGDPPPPPKNQKYRCGKCDDCLLGDCGECLSCLDKPKFGGRGCRKQGCKMRRCAHLRGFRGGK